MKHLKIRGVTVLKKIILLLAITVLLSGCSSKQINVYNDKANLLSYSFKVKDTTNIDKELKKQKFTYSKLIDKKVISLITCSRKKADLNEFEIENNNMLDIEVTADSDFIISLPYNQVVAYNWNVVNDLSESNIKLLNITEVNLPYPKEERGKVGIDYSRRNFYFRAAEPGTQPITFEYEHNEKGNNNANTEDSFQITLNITVS